MIGWWTNTDLFTNGNICIIEIITYIQNTGNNSMQTLNINVDYEGLRMCHRTVELIKTNTLNIGDQ